MRFFGTALFAVATLASIVSGQASGTATAPPTTAASPTPSAGAGDGLSDNPISAPTAGDELAAGKPVTIVWSPTTDGTVTLRLRKGDSDNLDVVQEIIKDIPNSGTYTWTPSSKLEGDNDYAIEIVPKSGSPNYTPKFSIDSNGKGLSSSTTSTATTLSTSTTKTTSSSTTKTTDEAKETETVTTTAKSTKTTTSSASTKTTDAEEEEEKEAVPNTNSASGVSSPLALVLCLAAAVAYLN